jgi:transketolase
VRAAVVNVAVIKPLDAETITRVAGRARAVITAENHLVTGGLGTAVAEVLAEAGLGRALRRIGLRDTFAEGALTAPYLFGKYGLSTQSVINEAWDLLGQPGQPPAAEVAGAEEGEYSPV